jgi:ubiquinone/menaquinone biosynthesis C-methylase UbiE
MKYHDIIKKCEESSYLIGMLSLDEIIRFGYSIGLNEESKVLDLCCGYGEILKIWNEAFGISGTGVDICNEFISAGKKRLSESGISKIRLIEGNVLSYFDDEKYDVVICSETFNTIEYTLRMGEKYLKESGILVYHKVYSKVPDPPQELLDFEGEVLPLQELNKEFNRLGYYITNMASDSVSDWERYIMWSARRNIEAYRKNRADTAAKEWMDKWYCMYFDYRRPYQGQALFGLEKI